MIERNERRVWLITSVDCLRPDCVCVLYFITAWTASARHAMYVCMFACPEGETGHQAPGKAFKKGEATFSVKIVNLPLAKEPGTKVTIESFHIRGIFLGVLVQNKLLSDMRFGPDMFLNMSRDMVII